MRKLLAIFLVLLISQSGIAQTISLEVDGDIKIVKVDRIITVKEDRTVAMSFPFVIKAPPGKAFYFWQYPDSVTAIKRSNKLEITAAPKGTITVIVEAVSAKIGEDGKTIVFTTEVGQTTLDIGTPSPPPPPPPDPEPDTELVKALKAAASKETNADKAKLPQLAEIYKTAADYSKDTRFITAEDVNKAIKAVREKAIGNALPNVRGVINAELQKSLPTTPTPLREDQRAKMQEVFSLVADSINQLLSKQLFERVRDGKEPWPEFWPKSN